MPPVAEFQPATVRVATETLVRSATPSPNNPIQSCKFSNTNKFAEVRYFGQLPMYNIISIITENTV